MNRYSFKRFLENPRPRYPIQLVRSDANNILVQGDLPDCVQTPSNISPPIASNLNPSDDIMLPSTLPNLVEISGDFTTERLPHLTMSLLPDVHPSHTSPRFQSHTLDNQFIFNDTPSVLPDFLADRRPTPSAPDPNTNVTSQQSTSVRDTSPALSNRCVRSTSVPTIPLCNSNGRPCLSVDSSNSIDQLQPLCAEIPDPLLSMHQITVSTSENHVTSVRNDFSQASDVELIPGSDSLPRCRNRSSQEACIHVTELQSQLHQIRAVLAERELQLETIRAEMLVNQRQSELQIKALEHELAQEKLHSAQDRWLVLQLRAQLSMSHSQNPSNNTLPSNPNCVSAPMEDVQTVSLFNSQPASSSSNILP